MRPKTHALSRRTLNRYVRTVVLSAAFFLAACSGPSNTSTLLHQGHRLHSPESFCSGTVLLNPPAPTEHPRAHSPRIPQSVSHVKFVGPTPVPDILYTRITITEFGRVTSTGIAPDFNNTPEWVVIYPKAKITVLGGRIGPPRSVPRPLANETVVLLFDPSSGSYSGLNVCPSGV